MKLIKCGRVPLGVHALYVKDGIRMSESVDELLRVGVITSPHGIKGEVNIFPTTDEPQMFEQWKKLILKKGTRTSELSITQAKYFKQMVILGFEEITDRNQAETLRQAELYITRDQALPCGENENFITDIIGLEVVDESGSRLGICTDVFQTGANDVYEIELDDSRKVLFPAIPSCILKVDLDAHTMTVHVLDGLID